MHCRMHNFTRKCQGAGKSITLTLIMDYTLFLFHALNYITGVKNVIFCPEFSLCRGSLFWSFLSIVCDIYIIKCSHPRLFCIGTGNSMISSDIWHKYHELYFKIVISKLFHEPLGE